MKKILIRILALTLICVLLVGSLASCKKKANYVKLTIKDIGVVVIQLDRDNAPKTCENFVKLVDEGFYNGLTFHRVITGFMVQGGCPEGTGRGNSGTYIEGEFFYNGHSNAIRHVRSTVSMARGNSFNSASCQFFICVDEAPHLDGQYAGFGKLIDGYDVLDKIATCKTGSMGYYMQDVPRDTIEIESIDVLED